MSSTLEQLRREFTTPCPSLTEVRERYFTHIRTNRYLIQEIKSGRIQLKFTKLHGSLRAIPVVYLNDLAAYLDSQAPEMAA